MDTEMANNRLKNLQELVVGIDDRIHRPIENWEHRGLIDQKNEILREIHYLKTCVR